MRLRIERGMTRGRDEAAQRQRGRRCLEDQPSTGPKDDRQRRDPGCHGRSGVPDLGKGAGYLAT